MTAGHGITKNPLDSKTRQETGKTVGQGDVQETIRQQSEGQVAHLKTTAERDRIT